MRHQQLIFLLIKFNLLSYASVHTADSQTRNSLSVTTTATHDLRFATATHDLHFATQIHDLLQQSLIYVLLPQPMTYVFSQQPMTRVLLTTIHHPCLAKPNHAMNHGRFYFLQQPMSYALLQQLMTYVL